MKPLIIAVSGKKQSGKSSLCDFLKAWHYVNHEYDLPFRVHQDADGAIYLFNNIDTGDADLYTLKQAMENNVADPQDAVRFYSFADALKRMLVKILKLKPEQCYGTDAQKNSYTQYKWEQMPMEIRLNNSKETKEIVTGVYQDEMGDPITLYETVKVPRSGPMTAREVMQVVGTDIFRVMFYDTVWVDSCFTAIADEKPTIALIADCRFPSEMDAVVANGGYVIRLERVVDNTDQHPSETALDKYDFKALGDRCLIIQNEDYEINQKNEIAAKWVEGILSSHA